MTCAWFSLGMQSLMGIWIYCSYPTMSAMAYQFTGSAVRSGAHPRKHQSFVWSQLHYSHVIMSTMASQIAGIWPVCSGVCSGAHHLKHQSSVPLAYLRGITYKGLVTRKIFPFVTSSCIKLDIADCIALHVRYLFRYQYFLINLQYGTLNCSEP